MRDGKTQPHRASKAGDPFDGFRTEHRAKLVIIDGACAGREIPIGKRTLTIGRGPQVDAPVSDPAISRQHAVLEFDDGAFRVRDLGSTNGVRVDGRYVSEMPLLHGDRFGLGDHVFQLVIETVDDRPIAYEITVDA